MPVRIGAKPESNFEDPIGLLTDCHRRIETFLSVLVKVCNDARGGPMSDEQRVSTEKALQYFRNSGPKHTADEEQALFPRLRSCDEPKVKAVMDRVDALEAQHVDAGQKHEAVDNLFSRWLTNRTLSADDVTSLSSVILELAELYRAHIHVEESEVFPAAAAVLSETELREMGQKMAEIRGLR